MIIVTIEPVEEPATLSGGSREVVEFRRWRWAADWVRDDVLPFGWAVMDVTFTGIHALEVQALDRRRR